MRSRASILLLIVFGIVLLSIASLYVFLQYKKGTLTIQNQVLQYLPAQIRERITPSGSVLFLSHIPTVTLKEGNHHELYSMVNDSGVFKKSGVAGTTDFQATRLIVYLFPLNDDTLQRVDSYTVDPLGNKKFSGKRTIYGDYIDVGPPENLLATAYYAVEPPGFIRLTVLVDPNVVESQRERSNPTSEWLSNIVSSRVALLLYLISSRFSNDLIGTPESNASYKQFVLDRWSKWEKHGVNSYPVIATIKK